MKKTICILLVVLSCKLLLAQDSPFPDSNAQWSYFHATYYETNPPVFDYYTTHFALFNNRIFIDDTIYSKLYSTSDSIFPEDLSNVSYNLIRTEGEKVYYYTDCENNGMLNNYLIYDFGLNVGDTMDIVLETGYESFLVCQGIDSIMINEVYRKRWLIVCPETNFWNYWIEGIGSNYNFLSTLSPFFIEGGESWELLCFEEAGNLVYENNGLIIFDPGCHEEGFFNPWGIDEQGWGIGNIYVSPNPVSNTSAIRLIDVGKPKIEVCIYTITGHKIKTISGNSSELFIHKEDYTQGVYFIRAIIDSKTYTAKFIIL